jgi:hypothetical protein
MRPNPLYLSYAKAKQNLSLGVPHLSFVVPLPSKISDVQFVSPRSTIPSSSTQRQGPGNRTRHARFGVTQTNVSCPCGGGASGAAAIVGGVGAIGGATVIRGGVGGVRAIGGATCTRGGAGAGAIGGGGRAVGGGARATGGDGGDSGIIGRTWGACLCAWTPMLQPIKAKDNAIAQCPRKFIETNLH